MVSLSKAPFASVALAAIVLAGAPVFAQDAAQAPNDNPAQQGERLDRKGREGRAGKGWHRKGIHKKGMFGRMSEQIGLTEEQQTRIEEIHKADSEAMKAARTLMSEKRRSLEEAIAAEPANQADIDARINELSAAQTEMMRLSTGTRLKVLQVLTPEQRTKLRESRELHRSHFRR